MGVLPRRMRTRRAEISLTSRAGFGDDAASDSPQEFKELSDDFFPDLASQGKLPRVPLVRGVVFDFEGTLAYRTAPLDRLMEQGARNAEAFMRSQGMDLPQDFWQYIVEARRFAAAKSEEEQEEHNANDTLSFLLQFYGYPAGQVAPEIVEEAVDIFYEPELVAWQLHRHATESLAVLRNAGYRLGIVENHSYDRIFQRTIDHLGLRRFVDLLLSSASVEYRKPDPAIFDIVLKQWDVLPYELVVVGDSPAHDIAGAVEVGAMAVRIRHSDAATVQGNPASDTHVSGANNPPLPDVEINSLAELPAIVAKWASP